MSYFEKPEPESPAAHLIVIVVVILMGVFAVYEPFLIKAFVGNP